jgi:uncharacterized protein
MFGRMHERTSPCPGKVGRVNDFAGILSEETMASLSSDLEEYEKETCHQLVILIVPSLRGETIKELSARIAFSWEVIHPVLGNGILLTIAIDEGQARIEMGTALEDIIEQGVAENILNNEMFPSFREENFDDGITKGVRAIQVAARKLAFPDELKPPVCRQE